MPKSGSKGRIVQGYLGPFQIGTRLTLLCQVIGGERYELQYRNLEDRFMFVETGGMVGMVGMT